MSEEATETPIESTPDGGAATTHGDGAVLRGTCVAPGLALGVAHRKDYDLARAQAHRVPLDEIDNELNRLRKALDDSALQLRDLKSKLDGRVDADDIRILDTHLAYLKDSVFIADVENLILGEQMALEGAIAKVIGDFDSIFHLVENETLRQSAVDLRDVGIRVLRNLVQEGPQESAAEAPATRYVLVARELSIVDMFNLKNDHVLGIVTEEGGLTGHAAIFARSMRIPTITAVEGLLSKAFEGDFLIVDATEGLVRVNPGEVVREQYRSAASDAEEPEGADERPAWADRPARTHDGELLDVRAVCGSLPEVDLARRYGMHGLGLYRTELLYLIDNEPPSRDALVRHYRSVATQCADGPVTFRLLHVDSGLEIPWLHPERELNPQLGHCGVRLLLARESLLRRQLQAICLATEGVDVRIAIPFVNDCGEIRRVKEILFEEKLELRRAGESFQDQVQLGCVVETPASLLGIRDVARESEFLAVNLDSLTQYILAADRESGELGSYFESLHPFVLRALSKVASVAANLGRELSVFGVTAVDPTNLAALLGTGLRSFCLPPSQLEAFLDTVAGIDVRSAARGVRAAARSSCPEDMQTNVGAYRHGWAQP